MIAEATPVMTRNAPIFNANGSVRRWPKTRARHEISVPFSFGGKREVYFSSSGDFPASVHGPQCSREIARCALEVVSFKADGAKNYTHQTSDAQRQAAQRPGEFAVLGHEVKTVEHFLLSKQICAGQCMVC